MRLIVYTVSESFKNYFSGITHHPVQFEGILGEPEENTQTIYFLHISSLGDACLDWLKTNASKRNLKVVVCSNLPDIQQMLVAVHLGVKSYCNSFMQTQHYEQLIRLVDNGQSWFPPDMLSQTFELAHKAIHGNDEDQLLEALTSREKDIARAVSQGLSNNDIAKKFTISEPTVKTHLTNIFKKLQLKDRVALILYLK